MQMTGMKNCKCYITFKRNKYLVFTQEIFSLSFSNGENEIGEKDTYNPTSQQLALLYAFLCVCFLS